ncbi:synaptic vesicular amine transporter-like [Dermatophagoides pteronyssinus]|uniref:synaptic vesicular amine transporter-like n=1 Tax=Dermatophagoides pteronyssinus TaxID=6956 RepID=UPI003F66A43A
MQNNSTTTSSQQQTNSSNEPSTVWEKLEYLLSQCRDSRKLVLVIVAIGLLLDNMLLTSVVPIIPAFLYELNHEKDLAKLNESLATTTTTSTLTTPINGKLSQIDQTFLQQSQLLNRLFFAPNSPLAKKLNPECEKELEDYLINNVETTTMTDDDSATTRMNRITTLSAIDAHELRHKELVNENTEVGVMFASKPIVQAITNPFVGPLTNKIGYSIPLFMGLILLFFSTMIFAVGSSYATLFMARSLQGIGSAFTSVAGMGLLADKYPDDRERGNSMAIALGGLALGVLIGPPFGGIMYEFIGKSAPFIILAMFALLDGCLQLLVLQPKVVREEQEGASLLTLIRDPYILVAAGAITFANIGIAILEPSLPLWMMDTMESSNWEQGAAFLPASISYLIGTNIFGPLGHRMGRWLASMCGLIIIGLALLYIPMATDLSELIVPNALIGFAIGMVDSSMMPMLGYLVDIRHTSIYGSVYAIGDVAFCIGFTIGPVLSGTLVSWFGFTGLCTTSAFISFAFAPCMLMLRNPPCTNQFTTKSQQTQLLNNQEGAVKYVSYTDDLDSPDIESSSVIGGGSNVTGYSRNKSFDMVP